ncbi:MAG: 50S ribosomal protein L25/general stress protein Ctc [Gammaproteobacteria bacterium]|nr:50S ribosomal protein L25/general stress protein Ctc [Gammaproteobacteria bacterium]
MSETYELTAETRAENGKGSSRRMRRLENKFPAIIYGGDKNPEMVSLDHNTFVHALENEGFYSHILTLSIGGKKEKVVLKDLHRHPSKPKILHADFLRVSAKTKITMNVPLHFKGEEVSPGVKTQGGIVSHLMSDIEVRCLPGNLPEFIEIDLSGLSIGDAIHLSELKLPKGVEITALAQGKEFDQPVVSIHKPSVAEETPAAETPESAAKPEGESEV